MKRITLIICLVFCCFNLFAQRGFPKSAKEDKEKIVNTHENGWNEIQKTDGETGFICGKYIETESEKKQD